MASFDPGAAAAPDSGIFGLPHTPDEAQVVLVPVPFEATCSYGGGTSGGPDAILKASRQVDLFDVETGRPYEAGIAMLPIPSELFELNARARAAARPVIEAGGVTTGNAALQKALEEVNLMCTEMNRHVRTQVETWLNKGKLVGVVGGDHSVPFGAMAALAQRHPGMGVLHVDAHADLRLAYEGFTWSHASIMRNVADGIPGVGRIVQVAIRDQSEEEWEFARQSGGRVVQYTDLELQARLHEGQSWNSLVQRMIDHLPKHVYVSFDIDGFDPALCPHTGTPVPGGLSWPQALTLLRLLARSGRKIVGLDLNEVAPGEDEWDANVGARLLYKMIGWALKTVKS